MKVICSKENLLEGINIVQKAVSSKSTLQILEGILLEANESFKLTGNDLEIAIECFVEADIQREGSIVINSKVLGDIVRRLPDAETLIEVKESGTVIIECENSHFEIKGIPSDGYPAIPSINKESSFSVNQKIVREMIRQTVFAVSTDENRPVLTGALVECKSNDICFVAIDGFRLAMRKSRLEKETADFSVIVPGKTLNEIVKIIQPVDEEMLLFCSRNQILFDLGKVKVVSRLIEGEYLNYNNIIPKESETKIIVDTKEFLSSLERASLITSEEKKYPVKISIGDEKMIISSSTEIGAVREEIRIDMKGNKIEIGFNPRYIIEALKVIENDKVEINYTSSIGPSTIRPIEGDSFAYMILPVRIKSE
jgi:DNA polymerase-3 subunit beta